MGRVFSYSFAKMSVEIT